MSQNSETSNSLVVVCLGLVGLNLLGLYWLSSSVSSMSDSLRSIDGIIDATAFRNTPQQEELRSADVDVSSSAGLRVPGVSDPSFCPPELVNLPPDTKVIGVEMNGQTRAYVVEAFEVHHVDAPEDLSVHVVNDTLGETPIAITHCNRTRLTRVLTNIPDGGSSLSPVDVCVGGWQNGMLLVVDDEMYSQHAREVPLIDVPFLTTTWSRWREQHPESLVYTGQPCDS